MTFRELIKIANRNLTRSKLRTFLTITAIFIGALTLVLTNAIGDGARDFADKQVRTVEADNILIVRKKFERQESEEQSDKVPEYKEPENSPTAINADRNSFTLTKEQVEANVTDIKEIVKITPRYNAEGLYITLDGEKKYLVDLQMLSEGFVQKTEHGKTIDGANQIMLPVMLAETLTENISSLVGRDITVAYKLADKSVRTIPLRIVGISTKGVLSNFSSYIDSETARKIHEEQNAGNPDAGNFGAFSVLLDPSLSPEKIAEVKQKMDEKGLIAESVTDRRKRSEEAILIVQIGLNFFAFIALLAASFGIINTLVIAVMERTKEIGLQKAVGMGRRKIFALFSIESVLIGFWGAISGIVVGIFIGTVTNLILRYKYPDAFEIYSLFYFRPLSIFFIILLICTIAFLAGVFPAYRASRLNPIEALRYE